MLDITRFIMGNFVYLAEALAAMPEGGGSLLDNSLIVGTSEHAIAGNHSYTDHPFVMVGGAGGRIRTGMHDRHPNAGGNDDCPKSHAHRDSDGGRPARIVWTSRRARRGGRPDRLRLGHAARSVGSTHSQTLVSPES